MIITLKGANFANSNIGTLDSYSIRFSGNVTNSNTSVDRDENTGYTTTIVLKDGYELSGSITVTMGGTDITSTAVSGLTITIPTKVTGNVVITVPTKNTATGEESYTFTINPDPTSATVTLSATGYSTVSGTGSKSITVANGTEVNWSVSADGYTEQTGTWTANGENKIENIVLIAAGNSGERVVIAEKADYNIAGFCRPTNGSFGGTTDTSYKRTDYIDITAYSTLYAYCQPRAASVSPISFFDAEKVWISGITPNSDTVTEQQEFTADVPANAIYAIFSGFSNSNPLKAEGILK